MKNSDKPFKKIVKQKYLSFQKNGLMQYLKYLQGDLAKSLKYKNRKAYSAYLEKQITQTEEKLNKVKGKLKKYNA